MLINCPLCGKQLEVPPGMAGEPVRCSHCGRGFVTPAASVEFPPEPEEMFARTGNELFAAVPRRFKTSSSLFDIFDFRFEKYVTLLIIRATWIIAVIVAAILLLQTAFDLASTSHSSSTKLPQAQLEFDPDIAMRGFEMPSGAQRVVSALLWIASIVDALLWVRVLLEQAIVLFNIASSVASIDKKTKA